MDDRQLYETVLGLARPWYVAAVEFRADRDEIWVHLDVESEAMHACPECGEPRPSYDRVEERSWRHLDTCQYQTIIKTCVPRVEAPRAWDTPDPRPVGGKDEPVYGAEHEREKTHEDVPGDRRLVLGEDEGRSWRPDVAAQASDSLERCLRCLGRLVRGS